MQSSMKLGEAIYKDQQAAAGAAGSDPEAANDSDKENVVDAEYEEVSEDDDKKSSAA